jgi:hypothetical protein
MEEKLVNGFKENFEFVFLPIIWKSIHDVLINSVQRYFFICCILNCHCC